MKVINRERLRRKSISPKKTQYSLIEKEMAIMKKLSHPYIIKLIEIIDDPLHYK